MTGIKKKDWSGNYYKKTQIPTLKDWQLTSICISTGNSIFKYFHTDHQNFLVGIGRYWIHTCTQEFYLFFCYLAAFNGSKWLDECKHVDRALGEGINRLTSALRLVHCSSGDRRGLFGTDETIPGCVTRLVVTHRARLADLQSVRGVSARLALSWKSITLSKIQTRRMTNCTKSILPLHSLMLRECR